MTKNEMPTPPEPKLKIYFLPNLFTAANLFCGFVALTYIVGVDPANPDYGKIKLALGFILLACIFDLFDGRVARMAGVESPFGREFDSLADLVSFGVAPAFLVHRVVLRELWVGHPEVGWFISSIYLLAGASLTLLMIHLDDAGYAPTKWKYALPVLLLFLSAMMVSTVKYPTFKKLDFKATSTFWKTMIAALLVGSIVILRERILYIVMPILFTAFLLYGFIRPYISRRMQHEIEDDDSDEEEPAPEIK
jgi:CDP-diacylglycerol---serine O-phosphatidyltransferase